MRRYRRHFGNVLNDIAMFIFTHQTSPGFTGQLGVKAFLHPFDALIINIGKAQQIGSHVARRVEPSRFIAQVDARQMQFIDPLCLLGIDLTRQIEKASVGMTLYPLGQLSEVEVQRFGHRLPAGPIAPPPFSIVVCGSIQIALTGTLTASGRPSRSLIIPRSTATGSSRRERISSCFTVLSGR